MTSELSARFSGRCLRARPTAAALALFGLPIPAATVTWDNSNATNAWSTPANWDTNIEPLAADDVVLPLGLAATLTLTTTENAKTLTIDDNYTLTGGTLALASASSISVSLGKTAAINNSLTITGGTTKTGDGVLTLSGSNTFTGGIIVSAGTLRVSNANALGAATNVATVNAGAVLEVTNGISFDRAITLNNGGTVVGSGAATNNGKVTIDALATAVTFATTALADVFVVGNGANDVTGGTAATTINVSGPGAVRLGAASDFDGSWNVASGVTLSGGALAGRLTTATTFTGQTNLTLTASSSLISDRSSAGAGIAYTFGALAMGAHTLTVAPGVNATTAASTAAIAFTGATLDLRNDASTNYAHPLTMSSGTNTINVDRAVGGVATGGTHTLGTIALANLTLNTTGSHGFGLAFGAVGTTGTSTLNHDAPGALTVAGIALGGTSGTFTFTQDGDGGDVFVTGTLAESGTPIYNFAKRGSHTLHLGAGFTARGTVTVADGTLDLNHNNVALNSTLTIGGGALSTAASIVTGTGALTLGGTLTYSANSALLAANITGNLDLGAATRTFTINDNGNAPVDLELAGVLSGPAGIGFTKGGTGTLRMSGAGNTLNGLALVQAGTVELNKTSGDAIGLGGLSINSSSAATVRLVAANQINDAATVGVTNTAGTARLDLAGFSETLGAASITAATTSGASITTGAAGMLVLTGNIDDGAGTFSLVKKGDGFLSLTGLNTHGGGTSVEKGTLAVSADASLGAAGVAVTLAGGALFAEGSVSSTRDVVLTGAGSIRVDAPLGDGGNHIFITEDATLRALAALTISRTVTFGHRIRHDDRECECRGGFPHGPNAGGVEHRGRCGRDARKRGSRPRSTGRAGAGRRGAFPRGNAVAAQAAHGTVMLRG